MSKATRYPPELRERAIRLVREHRHEHPSEWAAIQAIAGKLGMTAETLRLWVRRDEVDHGRRPGITSAERERLRANEILKAASAFFACRSSFPCPGGLARFFAAQLPLWLVRNRRPPG